MNMMMAGTVPSHNLFSSLPSPPFPSDNRRRKPSLPIPIPKYPPLPLRSQNPLKPHPSFHIPHRNTKFYKPIKGDAERIVIPPEGEAECEGGLPDSSPSVSGRAVVIGESGVSYLLPGAPFEFQFSYSETPKLKPLAFREPAFLPFAPPSMPRPWTGKAPLKGKDKKKNKGIPLYIPPNSNRLDKIVILPQEKRTRDQVLGQHLSKAEIKVLIHPHLASNRQVNLGRDGLTHNMLDLVHTHWKRNPVCKVRCRGVPTVDMDNVCIHLEEKTGGKIIHRAGGVLYLFRGRNYNYRTRPQYPLMLWKPATPVYPKLIQEAPEGLTKVEANELRKKGKALKPICKLAKNGIYIELVNEVRHAFEGSILVKIDCRGLEPSDYKKIGAKLKVLVPCVLLSFDDEHILMWRGHNWKSMYPQEPPTMPLPSIAGEGSLSDSESDDGENILTKKSKEAISSPRMMSLWKRAIESNNAMLLEETAEFDPDELLEKVEEFERVIQATKHSYPAVVVSSANPTSLPLGFSYRHSFTDAESQMGGYSDDENDEDYYGDAYDDDLSVENPHEGGKPNVPLGSLPVDFLARQLLEGE